MNSLSSLNSIEVTRPMSAKELTTIAKEFNWNPRIGFKYWVRAAETCYHEGQVYLREANFASAYMILFRYSVLVLENLPNHPEAKEPDARRSLRPHQKRIPRVIDVLERLRPEIDKTYDQWLERQTTRRDADREPLRPPSSYTKHAANDSAFSWSYGPHRNIINARDYQDLAVDLAKRKMRRRTPETGLLEDDNGVQRSLDHQREPSGKPSWRFSPHDMNDDELRRQMEETRRQLDRVGDHKRDDYRSDDSVQPATYYYPSIIKASTLRYEVYEPSPSPARDESSRFQPPRPPKESFPERVKSIRPPPRPGKEPFRSSPPPRYRLDEELGPALPPKVAAEPAAKQSIDIIEPAARLENGDPLRAIFLPTGLRQKFLDIAEDNTRILGIETCGLLCGAIVSNAFVITHLVIPEQKGTPDTCETVNEAAITNFCIEKELVTIGWIHTHPTQTCFMSSRDLHTHCSNQALLPESIAIVCAPRHEPSWGIFRLTNPPGLPAVLGCQKGDVFHEHHVDNLYVEASHVVQSDEYDFQVCDLRPGHQR